MTRSPVLRRMTTPSPGPPRTSDRPCTAKRVRERLLVISAFGGPERQPACMVVCQEDEDIG